MSASTATRDAEATIRDVIEPLAKLTRRGEGEGPFFMHNYAHPSFRDLVARVAERATGAPLRRGARARASTDAIVPSRAGYPTATLVSWEPGTKLQSNYHLPTDVPEHVRYDTVATAVTIAEALARELAA